MVGVREYIPICKAGTCSIGFTSRYSLQCCSPPDLIKLIGLISYGISFRLRAIRTRHEQELLQYEYRTGCKSDILNWLVRECWKFFRTLWTLFSKWNFRFFSGSFNQLIFINLFTWWEPFECKLRQLIFRRQERPVCEPPNHALR